MEGGERERDRENVFYLMHVLSQPSLGKVEKNR